MMARSGAGEGGMVAMMGILAVGFPSARKVHALFLGSAKTVCGRTGYEYLRGPLELADNSYECKFCVRGLQSRTRDLASKRRVKRARTPLDMWRAQAVLPLRLL